MVSNYEKQYMDNLINIYKYGVKEKNERTGIMTRRIPSSMIMVDLEREFPILLSKKVNWKTALNELLWIYQKQSNRTSELNSHIWDPWTGEDGTIGKSYGYQVGAPVKAKSKEYDNQIQYIIDTLQNDPSSRQAVVDIWEPEELGEMNLVPCCYSSVWNVIDGRLNCMLVQRSADYPVGVPFDTTEHAILVHMIARHLGVRPGILTHVMADSHIYESQIEGVETQIGQYHRAIITSKCLPLLVFDKYAPENFWQIKEEHIKIINYEPMPFIKFDVAI